MREKPSAHSVDIGGTELAYWDWVSVNSEALPVMVFAHATGFHARVFDAIIEHFPDHRVIAFDLRGHGRSCGEPIENWATIADDIGAIIKSLSITDAVGVGHSMGAHALLQAASDQPGMFRQLVLFDPTIFAPEFYTVEQPLFTPESPHPAIKRKRHFISVEEMTSRFEDREPYSLFDARVFADYCKFALLPADGIDGMQLACTPEFEAGIYASSRSNKGILDAASTLGVPALIVRAKQIGPGNFKSSPTWPELASTMPNATDMHRHDRTHFHPLEDPTDAARIIKEALVA